MSRIRIQITRNLAEVIEVKESITLGRGKEASIVLLDQLVSRTHVRLTPAEGSIILEDLGSANGTFVNKVRVHSQLLEEGDHVEIGKTHFTYSGEEDLKPVKIIDLYNDPDQELDDETLIRDKDVEFHFKSVEDVALRLCALSVRMMQEQTPIEGGPMSQVEIALQEAIGNAIRHGHKYEASKLVKYRWRVLDDRIVFRVEDQGEGFDYRVAIQRGLELDAASAARERHAQGGLGGLGILMMLRCVDRVAYNQSGNECTLTKYFGDPPDGPVWEGEGEEIPKPPSEELSLEETNLGTDPYGD